MINLMNFFFYLWGRYVDVDLAVLMWKLEQDPTFDDTEERLDKVSLLPILLSNMILMMAKKDWIGKFVFSFCSWKQSLPKSKSILMS